MWDSRTTHRVIKSDKTRVVAYISMVPRHFASEDVIKLRRTYFEQGVATTHWPHLLVDRNECHFPPSFTYDDAPVEVKELIDGNNEKN